MIELFDNLASFSALALQLYSWMHIAAFVFSWIHADPFNPIVSMINRSTVPLWNWVQLRLPRKFAFFAPYIALLLILFGEITVPGTLRSLGGVLGGQLAIMSGIVNIFIFIVLGTITVVNNVIRFVFLLGLAWFIIGLVNPPLNNPIVRTILYLVDPLITPLQRILPRSKIDFSPLVLAGSAYILAEILTRFAFSVQARLVY